MSGPTAVRKNSHCCAAHLLCWIKTQKGKDEGLVSPTQLQGELHGAKDLVESGVERLTTPLTHDYSQGVSGRGEDVSIPIFTLKYGNVLIPVHGERSDCHVEDLAFAFQDPLFVRGVVNNAKI